MFEGKDARETAGSIRGQRGWLTRAANRLTRLYNELAATPTPVVVAKIEEAMREAEKRTIICAAGYQYLSEEEGLAEDGIRDQPRSRGLGDVYKTQYVDSAMLSSHLQNGFIIVIPISEACFCLEPIFAFGFGSFDPND